MHSQFTSEESTVPPWREAVVVHLLDLEQDPAYSEIAAMSDATHHVAFREEIRAMVRLCSRGSIDRGVILMSLQELQSEAVGPLSVARRYIDQAVEELGVQAIS